MFISTVNFAKHHLQKTPSAVTMIECTFFWKWSRSITLCKRGNKCFNGQYINLLSISSISIPSLCSLLLSDDQLFCPYMDVYVLWPRCSWTRSSAVSMVEKIHHKDAIGNILVICICTNYSTKSLHVENSIFTLLSIYCQIVYFLGKIIYKGFW